mmetsp:Transcript_7415/g.11077  ORF Transcript_7415/g.11077 Transcript_7415/m.11077 type:complete len:210 (+) Transcript_7415:53-682(+)
MRKQIYEKFVQIGRVVLLTGDDAYAGKLAVILDVVDHNRVLVHGPTTGVPKGVSKIRNVTLTRMVLPIRRMTRLTALTKVITESKVEERFAKSSLGRKLARHSARASHTDFDRFKVMVAKKQKNAIVAAELSALRASKMSKAKVAKKVAKKSGVKTAKPAAAKTAKPAAKDTKKAAKDAKPVKDTKPVKAAKDTKAAKPAKSGKKAAAK